MLVPAASPWSGVIDVLIHQYLLNTTSVCILWNERFDLQLDTRRSGDLVPVVSIRLDHLVASSKRDVSDFSGRPERPQSDDGPPDPMTEQLAAAIEDSHCEGFIAFQEDIPNFARSFYNASVLSVWRSQRSRFIFGYVRERMQGNYFEEFFFSDQPNLLVVEAAEGASTTFDVKTNRFVGSVHDRPEALHTINRFDSTDGTFEWERQPVAPDKLGDLMGREVVLAGFDYRPFVVVDFERQPHVVDQAPVDPYSSVHIDGTEVRILLTFCELYNCSVQFDSSERHEWGLIYANRTADGLIGMVFERRTQMGLGAMYALHPIYRYLDFSAYLGRSGVTCMVPAPTRLNSWSLPLKPFQFTMWLGVAVCLVLETLALLVTRHLGQVFARADESWWRSLQFGYHTTLKLFVSQASNLASPVASPSVRTILVSCYTIDIIITSIYGGGLSSILTRPIMGEAADSVDRLYKYRLNWTGTSEDWVATLRNATGVVIEELLRNYHITTFEEMREMAQTEHMGFVVERLTFGHFGNSGFLTPAALDRLKLMVDDIYYQFTMAFVPRLWPLLQQFDGLVYNWHSSGLDKFWEWRVTADFLNVNEQQRVEVSMRTNFDGAPVMLGMSNFAGLILVWLVGVALSIIVFALELMYFNRRQRPFRDPPRGFEEEN